MKNNEYRFRLRKGQIKIEFLEEAKEFHENTLEQIKTGKDLYHVACGGKLRNCRDCFLRKIFYRAPTFNHGCTNVRLFIVEEYLKYARRYVNMSLLKEIIDG